MEASGLAASARAAGKAAELDVAQHRTGPDGGEPKDGLRMRIDLLGDRTMADGCGCGLSPLGKWGAGRAWPPGATPARRNGQGKTCARCCVPDVRVVSRHVTRESSIGRAPKPSLRRSKATTKEKKGDLCVWLSLPFR